MRDSKFRGKRKDTGKWVYGYYYQIPQLNIYEILTGKIDITTGFPTRESYEVVPETIGQYTGLKDVNSKEIYEGDIVEIKYKEYAPDGETTIEKYVKGYIKYNYFGFDICTGQINGVDCYSEFIQVSMLCDRIMDDEWKIIGNIYQNPDLLN